MEPYHDSRISSPPQKRDIDGDSSSVCSPPITLTTSANASSSTTTTAATAAATTTPKVEDSLELQSRDFLLQRVRALEQQLKIRNSDCARLLAERQQLLPLQEKCASQKEMILALHSELDLAKAQLESAVEAMEAMKRRQRDQEHTDRIAHAERVMYGGPPSAKASPLSVSATNTYTTTRPITAATGSSGCNNNSNSNNTCSSPKSALSTPNIGRRNPGGTVVSTAAGPQLLYDSSDISSVGFAKNAKLPYDFLGGPGAQQQYLARYSSGGRGDGPDGDHDESEDAQVRRVIGTAKDQAEIEAKYAEMEDKEEKELMARIKALREGRK